MMEAIKLVSLLCAFSAISVLGDSAEERRKKFLDREWKGLNKCQKELNTPQSYVDDIFNKQIVPPQSGCYVKCHFTELGWLTKKGDFDVTASTKDMENLFSDEKHIQFARQILRECHQSMPSGSSQCDSASNILNCIFTKVYHNKGEAAALPHHSKGHKPEN